MSRRINVLITLSVVGPERVGRQMENELASVLTAPLVAHVGILIAKASSPQICQLERQVLLAHEVSACATAWIQLITLSVISGPPANIALWGVALDP